MDWDQIWCLSEQCPGAKQTNRVMGNIASWSREGIVLPVLALGSLTLNIMWFWSLQYKKNVKLLESVQRRDTRMVKDLEGKPEMWLRALGLFS